jgi:hypothetical protein
MLSMDSNPLQFNSERRFFGGYIEVKQSTSRRHSSPRRALIKDIHDGALKERLGT